MHVHHYKGGQEKVEKGGELKKSCKNGGGGDYQNKWEEISEGAGFTFSSF